MRVDLVRWLGVAVVLAAIALLLAEGEREAPAGLERMLAYDLDEPVRFSLEAGEREVRLLTWLATPPEAPLDVRRTEVYALGVAVRDAGGAVVLERTLWVPTHASWRSADLLVPPQVTPGEHLQPLDERATRIAVAGLVPEGGTLSVSTAWAPPGAALRGVAFRGAVATPLVLLKRVRERAIDTLDPLAPWPSSGLPVAWQEHALRTTWDRLGALPPTGGGLAETVRIETWFDRLPPADAPAAAVPVRPGGALAWLLAAPVTFEVDVRSADGLAPAPEGVVVRVRALDGTESLASGPGPFVAGPGEVALALAPDALGARLVRATVRGARRSVGRPPRIRLDAEGDLVAPDLRELAAWRVGGPSGDAAFPLEPGVHLRVTARPALGPGALPGLDPGAGERPVAVALRAVDGAGVPLGEWTVDVPSVPSAFERYTRGDVASARVGEPATRHVVPPAGTVRLVVGADRPADVTVEASADPSAPWVVQPGYELPADAGYTLVYEPYLERPWSAVAPDEVERLTREGRAVAIDAQVRLAPLEASEGVARTPRAALALDGPFELVAEPDLDGLGAGRRVRLGRTPLRVVPPPSGTLAVNFRVAPSLVGEVVTLTVGDRRVERTLVATTGTLRVDGVGAADVAVDRAGTFLATGDGEPAWQLRRVWRVGDGQEREIPLPAGAGSISVVAYRPSDAGQVVWRVEQDEAFAGLSEQPVRTGGAAVARWEGHPDAEPLSFAGAALAPLAPIVVHRPEGAPPARLVLRADGTGTAWVRATATWGVPEPEAPRHARQGAPE